MAVGCMKGFGDSKEARRGPYDTASPSTSLERVGVIQIFMPGWVSKPNGLGHKIGITHTFWHQTAFELL